MKVIQEDSSTLQKEKMGLTETSVKKYQHSQRNNTEIDTPQENSNLGTL